MDNQEQNDPVWELLQQASKTEVDPFFSRNVVREVRKMEQSPGGVLGGFFERFGQPVFAVGGALAAVAILVSVLLSGRTLDDNSGNGGSSMAQVDSIFLLEESDSATFDPAAEIETIEYLGQLMVVADPGQLSDDALADLFF